MPPQIHQRRDDLKSAAHRGAFLLALTMILLLFAGPKAEAADYKFSMSYIYFGSSSAYTELVDTAQDSLDEVSPNYFTVGSDGTLLLTPAVRADFVAAMHSRGIAVVPYLSNSWDRAAGVAALENRTALAQALAGAVSQYGLDGVNIDLENLTPTERTAYVDFIRLLRADLPSGKKIAVAVAPNPYGFTSGWQGSYDDAGLAQYSDEVILMAYDEHYAGGDAGPVASYSFVKKSIQYALTLIPKEKLVLGLPFYGRIWSNDGSTIAGGGVSDVRIDQLVSQYGGTVTLDAASRSACAVITVKASDPKPTVNGVTLPAGSYTIWYDNEAALKEKLSLVQDYGLKGAGSWSLGQESDDTWNYYKLWLNGCAFSDAETSWAKDYILEAYMNGWVNGVGGGSFAPDGCLTRAQAAALLVRCLGLTVSQDSAYTFGDCQSGWAQPYVETARKYGLVSGVGSNLFDPDKPVTREEIAVMLSRVGFAGQTAAAPAFTDVTALTNPWSYDAIETLASQGVITGYSDGTFRPSSFVSRAEMTAMAVRLFSASAS